MTLLEVGMIFLVIGLPASIFIISGRMEEDGGTLIIILLILNLLIQ